MTNEEARVYLSSQLPTITYRVESHFLTRPRPEGIAGMQDIDGRLLVFREYNDRYIGKFLSNYKLPHKVDDMFDPMAGAIQGYLKGLYGYARDNSNRAYWRRISKEISMDEVDELQSTTNIEEEFELKEARERISKANKAFRYLLNVQDRLIYEALSAGKKSKDIASLLYPDSKFDKVTENKTNYRIRLVEYRYAAWIIAQNIYSDKVSLAGLNRYPAQNKRYFGGKKLEVIPAKMELLKLANNKIYIEKESASDIHILKREAPKAYSKIDFNGKRHDHTVIYKFPNGTLYDHVTKTTRTVESA